MKEFDELKQVAAGNFGLVTAAQAKEMGISRSCLTRWVKMDWLERRSRGVYRLSDFPPSNYDGFAAAVESVGPAARLMGESVLCMLELTSTDPRKIRVGVPGRLRRTFSDGLLVTSVCQGEPFELYEGVRSQPVFDAIVGCKGKIVPSRLREAATRGRAEGYLTRNEYKRVLKEIGK